MVQVRVPPVHPVPSGAQFPTGMVVVPGETPVRISNASAGA